MFPALYNLVNVCPHSACLAPGYLPELVPCHAADSIVHVQRKNRRNFAFTAGEVDHAVQVLGCVDTGVHLAVDHARLQHSSMPCKQCSAQYWWAFAFTPPTADVKSLANSVTDASRVCSVVCARGSNPENQANLRAPQCHAHD
jgi:hypothetical protein